MAGFNNNNMPLQKSESMGNRALGLDIIRVALALMVFVFHSQMHFGCYYYWLNDFVQMATMVMTAFFILSGYSLHLSSSHKNLANAKDIKRFYIKRLVAILPLYYAVALLKVCMDVIVGKSTLIEMAVLFPVELFALQSTFTTLFSYSHNGGTWFISCIIICYIAYPFIQNLFLQLSIKTKIIILLVLCGILIYAPFIQHYFHLNKVSVYTSPFYRLIEFTIGVIIAQINTANVESKLLAIIRKPLSCFVFLIVLVMMASMWRRLGLPNDYMIFNVVAVPCFIVIMMSLGSMRLNKMRNPVFLIYLSSISYAFFLVQVLPLWRVSGYLCGLIGIESNIIRILVSFSICLIGAVALHHSVEKPAITYLKKKLL